MRRADRAHDRQRLNMPNGVAFRDGALYVAEVNRILRYDAIEPSLDKRAAPESRARRSAEGSASRLEVHRVWTRRQAVRADRRALQRLQRAELRA